MMNVDQSASRRTGELSYKFQRLREKLREAVRTGELSGKLPGERELARRFHVNAKTLSKALTDLAAEGLLQRSIGRGTFVKAAEASVANPGPWLLLRDPSDLDPPCAKFLLEACPGSQLVEAGADMRPSFLNQFKAAIDLGSRTSDALIRDLVVRNMPVVAVGCEPRTFSTHAVLMDRTLGVSMFGRDLMLAGHERFLAVESRKQNVVSDTLRRIASRYASDASVDCGFPADVAAAVEAGITAIICESVRAAQDVLHALHKAKLSAPGAVSVAAVGCLDGDFPCSGYFLSAREQADAIIQLLQELQLNRPTMVWLTGTYVDSGTTAAIASARSVDAAPTSVHRSPAFLQLPKSL
jgi:hypothetical protein